MRSPTYALIWEQWRQVKTTVIAAMGIAFAASLSRHVFGWGDPEDWASFSFAMAWGSLLLIMAVLLFAHSSVRDLRMGLPTRMLTLPLTARHIAATQIGFRFAVVTGAALILGVLLTAINGKYFETAFSLVSSIVVYAYLSVLATTIGRRLPGVAVVLAILTVAPVVATVYYLDNRIDDSIGFKYIAHSAFILMCMAASFISLARVRKPARIEVLFSAASSPSEEFRVLGRSAMGPFWYEWRTLAWIIPTIAAVSGAIIGVPLIVSQLNSAPDATVAANLYIVVSLIISFQAGMMLIGVFTARVSRTLWTKPVTIQDVILNRMRVVTMSLLLTHLALAGIGLFVFQLSGEYIYEIWLLPAMFIGIFIASWCMVWVPYLPLLYWAYAVCYLAITYLAFPALTQSKPSDFWLVAVPETVFLILLVWTENMCRKRRLFDRKIVARFIVLAVCIFAIGSLHLYLLDTPTADWLNPKYISTLFVFSLMPLFCLLSQGVFLDRMRHGVRLRTLPPREA